MSGIGRLQRQYLDDDASEVFNRFPCASFFDGKRVVVTGATGMLGGWVTFLLAQMRLHTGLGPESVSILRSGTSRATPIWQGLVPERQIGSWTPGSDNPAIPEADVYLHLASPASAPESVRDARATLTLNTLGTIALLAAAGRVAGSRMLFVSSSEIYGVARGVLSESTVGVVPLDNERWIYAESKRMGELLCRTYSDTANSVIVRPFHTFGPGLRNDDSRVFGDFISAIMRQQHITVISDPTTTRTFCYAPEAASALLLATARGGAGAVYNVAGQEATAIGALAESLTAEFLPAGFTVTYLDRREAPGTSPAPASVADTSGIRALGWESPTDVFGAFRRTVAFLRAG